MGLKDSKVVALPPWQVSQPTLLRPWGEESQSERCRAPGASGREKWQSAQRLAWI